MDQLSFASLDPFVEEMDEFNAALWKRLAGYVLRQSVQSVAEALQHDIRGFGPSRTSVGLTAVILEFSRRVARAARGAARERGSSTPPSTLSSAARRSGSCAVEADNCGTKRIQVPLMERCARAGAREMWASLRDDLQEMVWLISVVTALSVAGVGIAVMLVAT